MALSAVPDDCPLTPRQFEVLLALCEGCSYRQVGEQVGIAASTVRAHVHQITSRLGVSDIKQAIVTTTRKGWLPWQMPPRQLRRQERPEVTADPLTAATLQEIDTWLASGFTDQAARDAWHLTGRAACLKAGVISQRRNPRPSPLRDLLEHVAADTLIPSDHA